MSLRIFAACAALLLSLNVGASELLQQAAEAYSLRDYNPDGVKNAERAIELYEQALSQTSDEIQKLQVLNLKTTATYFVGSAHSEVPAKKAAHEKTMALAEQSMNMLGVDGKKAHQLSESQVSELMVSLNEEQRLFLAEAMYAKGISLAQWGNLNGVASSIGRLPEVLGLMERVEMLGLSLIHEYGPYRTIGRINFVLPALFGGDLAKSEEMLTQAYRETLAPGQRYSINGYNNVYLAETMHKRGKETQAKRLLETFLNADFETLAQGSEPENREALRLAQELLNSWQ